MIKELAAEHGLKKFKLGYFYSEVEREWLRAEMRAGNVVQGLDGFADLSEEELDATDRIVAMAGVHPFVKLLGEGADVIIGGRSRDSAIFAAPALAGGFPESLSYYLGRSEERRVGKEGVSTCRSRWSPYP